MRCFERTQLAFGGDHWLVKRPESLDDLGINDEVVEKMLDEGENEISLRRSSTDLEGSDARRRGEGLERIGRTVRSMILLNKVLRNNELLVDHELKLLATTAVLTHWAKYICFVLESFDRISVDSSNEESEARAKFDALSPQAKGYLENFVKVTLPVYTTALVYETVGTEKLRAVFDRY